MIRRRRVLLGIASMLAIATSLAGCVTSFTRDVQYVPGYGYVVRVVRVRVGGYIDRELFYIFNTEQEAQKFVEDFQRGVEVLGHEPRIASDRQPELFNDIEKRLQPVPRIPTPTIDRVVPPVPTGPAPQ